MPSFTTYNSTGMESRSVSSEAYRFGFQGQEKDPEWTGQQGSHLAFKYRIHDARIGRFLSIDPLTAKYPHNSPYAFSENRVIDGVEFEGLEVHLINYERGFVTGIGGYGYAAITGTGYADDQYGHTLYSYRARIKINKYSDASVAGLDPYIKIHMGTDYSSDTFEESIKKGPVTTVGGIPYATIDGRNRDTYIGASATVGGVSFTHVPTDITKSFSFTGDELTTLNKLKKENGISELLTADYLDTYEKDGENYVKMRFERNIFRLRFKTKEVETDIKVVDVSEDKEKHRWQSESYQESVENE